MQGDVEGLSGALTRLELLEEARNVWEDAMLTEAARRGELAGKVNRLQMELEALRRDGVNRQLHASDGIRDAIRDAIKEGALLDAFDEMKEGIRQEITPMLKRVQGLEVHSQTSIAKIDQRLANLEACSGRVGVGGLGWVEKELAIKLFKVKRCYAHASSSEHTRKAHATPTRCATSWYKRINACVHVHTCLHNHGIHFSHFASVLIL